MWYCSLPHGPLVSGSRLRKGGFYQGVLLMFISNSTFHWLPRLGEGCEVAAAAAAVHTHDTSCSLSQT